MNRRLFLALFSSAGALLTSSGCRGKQYAHVLKKDEENMVGSHSAGSEVFEPLIAGAVERLLGQEMAGIQQAGFNEAAQHPKRVCFIGVENASSEELGDFKEQIYEIIDARIVESQAFEPISRRYVEVGLRDSRLRPDELFKPSNQRLFEEVMERQGQPIDYLLFAKVTSGTTRSNDSDYQRDYLLTLEMINLDTGVPVKTQEKIRKGYHKSVLGRVKHY